MAIEVMEKALMMAPRSEAERLLAVLQSFQKVELRLSPQARAAGFVAASPETAAVADALNSLSQARAWLQPWQPAGQALARWQDQRPQLTWTELQAQVENGDWRSICTETAASAKQLEQLRQRRQELRRLIKQWSPWRQLPLRPETAAQSFHYVGIKTGSLPADRLAAFGASFSQLTEGAGVRELLGSDGSVSHLLLFYPPGCQIRMNSLLADFSWLPLDYPFAELPQELLTRWEAEEAWLVQQEKSCSQALGSLADRIPDLDLAEAYYQSLLLRQEARPYLLQSEATCLICGWIARRDQATLVDLLRQHFGDDCALFFEAVQDGETTAVPIRLYNGRIASAFESLTEMYSLPAYDEIDPTPVMTPFYLAFFGMMVADLGYGLVLLLVTLLARRLRPAPALKRNLDFFYYLSFPVMAWGLIYGSLFGLNLPWALLSPTRDIIPILILSLVLGWVQLMTGLGMNVYIQLKKRNPLEAWSGGGTWMLLLGGLALFLLSWQVFDSRAGQLIALLLCMVGILGIVILPVLQNRGHRLKGLLKGLYALYGTTSYVGDLVSYSRLMALGVAGSSIAIAFNTILTTLPLAARLSLGIVLAVLLHALNLFLSLLSAYVHGIRLQYVEFFGKFYQGGGRRFRPFKVAEARVELRTETKPWVKAADGQTTVKHKQAKTEGNI